MFDINNYQKDIKSILNLRTFLQRISQKKKNIYIYITSAIIISSASTHLMTQAHIVICATHFSHLISS